MNKKRVLAATIFIVVFMLFSIDFLISADCSNHCEITHGTVNSWCEGECEDCDYPSCYYLYDPFCDEEECICTYFAHCDCQEGGGMGGTVGTYCAWCCPQ